jgi:CheY-like chemotaxis protein
MNGTDGELNVERPSAQRRLGERRRLWERRLPLARRSSEDRRTRERRSAEQQVGANRRAGRDRRGAADRRGTPDRRTVSIRRHGRRRRETPTPFTAEEITDLRARFAVPGPVACPSCGCRFTLGPARRRGNDIARRVVCLGCGRAAIIPNSRAARILLITQHDALRDVLQVMLTSAGHEVIEAADAGVGLFAYGAVPADVVIIDVLAPGRMQAPEFLRQLRRTYPEARVVTMAGRPSFRGVDPLAITQGLGAARTFRMPLSRDDLLRIVEEVRP